MKQEFLKHFTHLDLTIAALLIFFLIFMVLILRATVFRNRELQEAVSRLPLEDEKRAGGESHV